MKVNLKWINDIYIWPFLLDGTFPFGRFLLDRSTAYVEAFSDISEAK